MNKVNHSIRDISTTGLSASQVKLCIGEVEILQSISLDLEAGEMIALVGPNGAGKSSVLKVLSSDLKPTAGAVRLKGKLLQHWNHRQQALQRSVMTQSSRIAFAFTVEEVLQMGWVQGGHWADMQTEAMQAVSAACDIVHLWQRTFNSLSGGEQQRVQFARALLQIWQPESHREARYLLLDEPTANLDLAHELQLLRIAKQATEQNVGVLIVLHDLNLAARFADTIVLLNRGTVAATGSPQQVLRDSLLTQVYGTPVRVEHHRELDRLVIYS